MNNENSKCISKDKDMNKMFYKGRTFCHSGMKNKIFPNIITLT